MCGILGTTKKISQTELSKALQKISHRGPDDSGFCEHGSVSLGHKRLSILDLSSLGHQPMITSDNSIALVFNGEIYNYRELRKELENDGVKLKSATDTEVILSGYEKYGSEFFSKLRGMWSIAISDKRRNKIILSRDYFGIKPLYFFHNGSELSFSSELSPLAIFHEFVPDREAYKKYYVFGMMPGKTTGVQNVYQVLPGETIEFDKNNGELSTQSILDELKHPSEFNSLEDVLANSIKAHYVSDVPVGLLLSGGTDSSLIGALSKKLGFSPECYSVEIEGSSDAKYAREIARELGFKLNVISFDLSDIKRTYEKVLSHIDIPVSDISILPTSQVFEAASKHAKVVLSGEGGDELLGGYYRHPLLTGNYSSQTFNLPFISNSLALALNFLNPVYQRIQKFIDNQLGDIDAQYLNNSSVILLPNLRKSILGYLRAYRKSHNLNNSIPPYLFWDLVMYLPNILMVKADRASMMHSIEARVPFLDREVYKFLSSSKDIAEITDPKKKKAALKQILLKYIPSEYVHRKKKGFSFPIQQVLSQEMFEDFKKAVIFHEKHANLFGWETTKLPSSRSHGFYKNVMKKFPRFAFGLITSHAVWKKYGYE